MIRKIFAHRYFSVFGAGTVALAISVAGCGSSSEPLTKAEYIKQATAICEKNQEELRGEVEKFTKERKGADAAQTAEELEEMTTALIMPAMKKRGEELSDLSAPEGDEAKTEAIDEAFEKAIEATEKEPLALLSVVGPAGDLEKRTKEYGVEICGHLGA